MRILVGATLFLLVIFIISNDALAKKSVREKSERNKRSTNVEETTREKDASMNYKKKSSKIKNYEEPRAKKRRSIDEVESDVTSKDNSGSRTGEDKYSRKSQSTEQRNKNRKSNEVPLKNKKNTKQDKKLDSSDPRSFKKSGKSSTVKKRSLDDSHISDNNGDHSSCKISSSKSCSKNYKPAKYIEKRKNYNHEENEEEEEEEDETLVDERVEENAGGRYDQAKNKRARENNMVDEETVAGKTCKKEKKNRNKLEKSHQCPSNKYDENKPEKSKKKCAVDKPEGMENEFEFGNKRERSKEIAESETDDLDNEVEEEEENEKKNQYEEDEDEEEVNENEPQD